MQKKGIVEYKKTTRLILVSHDEDTIIPYEFATSYKKAIEVSYTPEVSIDNEIAKPIIILEKELSDDENLVKYKVELRGKKEYIITKTDQRKFKIDLDPIQYYKTTKILKDITIDIVIEGNIEVEFKELGTLNSMERSLNEKNHIRYQYSGIIYPQQGYLLNLKMKK